MTAAPAGQSKAAESNDPFLVEEEAASVSKSKKAPAKVAAPAAVPEEPKPEDIDPDVDGASDEPEAKPEAQEPEAKPEPRKRAKKFEDPLAGTIDTNHLPVSVVEGQVQAEIRSHAGNVILSLSLAGWVGAEPLIILAKDAGEIEAVLDKLRKELQAKK